MAEQRPRTREPLMRQHREAVARREQAALGSDDFRRAAEDVARIEIEIAALEEPPVAGQQRQHDAA